MLETADQAALPTAPASAAGQRRQGWPAVMGKAQYGRYRREAFGKGSPPLVTKYIKESKITPPALRPDGKIDRALADAQLAAVLDPSRRLDRVDLPPPGPVLETDEDDEAPATPGAKAPDRTYSAAQIALTEARRRKVELEVASLEGGLIDKAEVERELFDIARQVRDRLLAVPNKLAAKLVGKSEPELVTLLRKALTEALDEAADDLEDSSDSRDGAG